MKIHKLNESINTTDEFYEIVDTVIGPAINSIGGDMDDITGDIAQTYDEDKFFVSLYSTVPRKLANRFSKNFLNTVQTALSKTRFSDVSLDSDRTFAYKLSRMDIHNHLGSERGDQFLSEFAMFEIGITAYGARLNEAMTIAYDKSTITNMIDRIQRNLEDYKSLLTEFPEDGEYWKEMIRKCELEIAELESYTPLNESQELLPIPDLNKTGEPVQYDVVIEDEPKTMLSDELAQELEKHLRETNRLWVEELYFNQVKNTIEFDINNGDWKHEHLRAMWLVREFFEEKGIQIHINSWTTEEDGSDCYSAHYVID